MRRSFAWLALLALGLLAGTGRGAAALEMVDATGRTVAIPDRVARVLPAGPPAAVLLAIVAPDLMVGWPHAPDAAGAALLSDELVRLPEIGLLAASRDLAKDVGALKPDLILDYGSIAPRYSELIERAQTTTGVPSILLDGKMAYTPLALRVLGRVLHREQRAEALARLAEGVLASVEKRQDETSVVYVHGPEGSEVAVPGGNNSELLESSGWDLRAPAGPLRGPFRPATVAEIDRLDPDIVIFSSEKMRAVVAASPEWRALRAVREGHAWIAPSEPFGWIEGPPSVNRLLGLAWLGGGAPSAGVVPVAAMFHAAFYGRTPTPGQIGALRETLRPIQP